jgi:hypothetical protein
MTKKGILFFAVVLAAFMLTGCPGTGLEPVQTLDIIGSWKSYSVTYTFAENGKLTRTYKNDSGEDRTNYYFYDSAAKEFYYAAETRSQYTLSGNSLTFRFGPFGGTWTATGNKDLIGTWTRDDKEMVIADDTITIGSDTCPYYTYSEGSTQYLVYKPASAEPNGHYDLSGGKLQFTTIDRPTYQREGAGTSSGIIGTWKSPRSDKESWTFNANKAAKRTYSNDSETNYLYELSGSKISMEEEAGTLSGNTLTLWGSVVLNRKDSGSGITGSWSTVQNGWTITCTITQDKMEYLEEKKGNESYSESMSIRIEGNNLYTPSEYRGYKLEGDTLTLIREWTEECSPVTN